MSDTPLLDMKVCVGDIDTALYLVCYNKKDIPPKSLEDCCKQMDELLTNIFETTGSTHYILYLTIGKNFRYEIDSTYKEARKKQEKPPFFYEVRQYLIDKYGAISHDNFESDDLCVTTRKLLLKEDLNCFIASPDKDIKMIEGETFDYKKFEWKVTSKEEAFYYFWSSMITGDSSDGIKGLPGKGIKFAENLINVHKNITEYECEHNKGIFEGNILRKYLEQFGEEQGIEEFYKNYKLLKIVEDISDFKLPELREVKIEEKLSDEIKF